MDWKNTLSKLAPFFAIVLVGIVVTMALCCGRTHFVQAVSGNTLLLVLTAALVVVVILGWFRYENQEKTGLSIIIPGLILAVFWIWQFIHLYKYFYGGDNNSMKQLQEIKYDGFVELLFAGVGIILTFTAFYIQYAANQQHLRNFEETRLDNQRARFENTFFDALRSIKDLVISQNINGIGNGLDVYRYMFWEYKSIIRLVEKVLGNVGQKEIIAFHFFINGVSVAPNSNLKLHKCLQRHIGKEAIDEMIKRINEAQIVNTTKETEVKKAIACGLFDGIGDYVQSSLINKKRVMWFDGHKHRLLPYIKMRLYATWVLQTDEFLNSVCRRKEDISQQERRQKTYDFYFEASFTEYEQELVRAFYLWLESLDAEECKVLEIQKEDYSLIKFV